jgi:hypothetical protein
MAEKHYNERIQIVWIYEESVYGNIISEGVYASLIRYQKDGIDHQVYLENDEFIVMDEIGFEHVEEEDGPNTVL